MRIGASAWILLACLVACGDAPRVANVPAASAIAIPPQDEKPTSAPRTIDAGRTAASAVPEEFDELGVIHRAPPILVETPALTRSTPSSFDAAFIAAGCVVSRGQTDCSKPLHAQVDSASFGPAELEYLTPPTPIAQLWEPPFTGPKGASAPATDIRQSRGMIAFHIAFLIPNGAQLDIVRSRADFIKRFAPVSSPEEAIAFAVVFTGARPLYAPQLTSGVRYYTDRFEGTRVVEEANAYRVTLFDQVVFGCGLKPFSREEVIVTKAGEVTTVSTVPMFADPKSKDLCVD